MKRHNFQLQSKLKYLEQEMDNLNDKLEASHKERSKLRKELNNMSQLSSVGSGSSSSGSGSGTTTSLDILDMRSSDGTPPPPQLPTPPSTAKASEKINNGMKTSTAVATTTTTISSSSRTLSTDMLDKSSFKSSSLNLSYWNELNASSSWDVNYNTGNMSKYLSRGNDMNENFVLSGGGGNHQKNGGGGEFRSKSYRRDGGSGSGAGDGQSAYIGSITSDLNAIINAPRPYR